MTNSEFVLLVFSVLAYLPQILTLSPSVNETTSLDPSVILVAMVSIGMLMFLETAIDFDGSHISFNVPRFLLTVAIFVPNFSFYLNSNSSISLYFSCYYVRVTMIAGAVFCYLLSTSHRISFKGKLLSFLLIIMALQYAVWRHTKMISNFGFLSLSMFAGIIGTMTIFFSQNVSEPIIKLDKSKIGPIVCLLCLLSYVVLHYVIHVLFHSTGWDNITDRELSWYLLLDAVMATLAVQILDRQAKHNVALQKQLELKKDFVRYVSHEIRTPLNTVSLGLQLLIQQMELVDQNSCSETSQHDAKLVLDAMVMIDDISYSCGSALDILNELLTYDKIEAGVMTLRKEYVLPFELLKHCTQVFAIQAKQAGITMLCIDDTCVAQGLTEKLLLYVDIFKFKQVFRNLLSNSLKFTPRGGSITVRLTLTEHDSIVRIEFKDSGCGIAKEDQTKLFIKSAQLFPELLQGGGGSGLGLWIAKTIVENHDGRIWIDSSGIQGEGSTFYVEIPATSAGEGERVVRLEGIKLNKQPAKANINTKRIHFKRTLVVDDSALNRKMLIVAIKKYFDEIVEACDGVEAVDMVKMSMDKHETINVIFLDTVMPRMDGVEACIKIRELGFKNFIISVSGNVMPSDVKCIMEAGANKFIEKPVNVTAIEIMLAGIE